MGWLGKALLAAGTAIIVGAAVTKQEKKEDQLDKTKQREKLFSELGVGVVNGKPYMTKDFVEGAIDRGKGKRPRSKKNTAYMNGYTGKVFEDIDDFLKEYDK